MNQSMKVYVLCFLLAPLFLSGGCPTTTPDAAEGNLESETQAPVAAADDPLPDVDPDDAVFALLGEAEVLVEQGHPRAVLIEALGAPAGAPAQTADDIVKWTFYFMEDHEAPAASTVILEWADGQFAAPQTLPQGIIGTMYERLPRTMTLATAITFMRNAGYGDPFSEVTLRKPLTFPMPREAYYIFKIGAHFVLVGMETGEVTLE